MPWIDRARELAEWTLVRCVNRIDAWGAYQRISRRINGSNSFTAKADGLQQLDRRRLERHYQCHNETEIVGLHTTTPDNTSLWGCFDIDRHDDGPTQPTPRQILTYALHLIGKLRALGFQSILLTDSNGKGGLHRASAHSGVAG
ncbi:MAG TPA: hypothetical protein VMV69_30445 [Pirellulales bacterium]|nr:hypothetical protein [Pirellulales bacterium]